MPTQPAWLDWALLFSALALALPFKPWLVLRHAPLQSPWIGAMVLLPWLWWTEKLLPSGLALHVSGVCLLVLMFGWPLAMWSLVPVGIAAGLIGSGSWQHLDASAVAEHIVWRGVMPGTVALALGLVIRHWLPKHLFVYILGRGFIVTALSVSFTGLLSDIVGHRPATTAFDEWMLAHWLLGWGEAISTGMLTAIFVAFKPHWLLTYSDQRYLPKSNGTG